MDQDTKACSSCEKFKSVKEFYKQAGRYESLCKECKRQRRLKRDEMQTPLIANHEVAITERNALDEKAVKSSVVTFTREEVIEIANFFIELRKP